jgi:hypothetical protein
LLGSESHREAKREIYYFGDLKAKGDYIESVSVILQILGVFMGMNLIPEPWRFGIG